MPALARSWRSSSSLNGSMIFFGTRGFASRRMTTASVSSSAASQLPKHVQAADVAGNAHRRQCRPKLDEPGAPGRRFDLLEDSRRAPNRATARSRMSLYQRIVRGDSPSAVFASQNSSHRPADLEGPAGAVGCCAPADRPTKSDSHRADQKNQMPGPLTRKCQKPTDRGCQMLAA